MSPQISPPFLKFTDPLIMNKTNHLTNHLLPRLPRILSLPLRYIPAKIPSHLLVMTLNQMLAKASRAGELDFLQDKVLLIKVQDAHLIFGLSLVKSRLIACPVHRHYDVCISGTAYDFLLLATGREDPDSLFFNRRLRLEGDTELGLYVKNFLAAVELEPGAQMIVKQLEHLLDWFEYSWQLRLKFR